MLCLFQLSAVPSEAEGPRRGTALGAVLQKMRRMIDFIREFKFGRPQQIAALLLLAFIALVTSFELTHVRFHAVGISVEGGPMRFNVQGQILFLIGSLLNLLRLPLQAKLYLIGLAFGLSLAGALWWVTRRLYNDEGGYVALAMFCFSLPFIITARSPITTSSPPGDFTDSSTRPSALPIRCMRRRGSGVRASCFSAPHSV